MGTETVVGTGGRAAQMVMAPSVALLTRAVEPPETGAAVCEAMEARHAFESCSFCASNGTFVEEESGAGRDSDSAAASAEDCSVFSLWRLAALRMAPLRSSV